MSKLTLCPIYINIIGWLTAKTCQKQSTEKKCPSIDKYQFLEASIIVKRFKNIKKGRTENTSKMVDLVIFKVDSIADQHVQHLKFSKTDLTS